MDAENIQIAPLSPAQAPEVLAYWREAHPLHPFDLPKLRERLFGPPDPDPELLLAARDSAGRLLGIAAGVFPCRKETVGGVRWVGALPGPWRDAVVKALLDALLPRLAARGAQDIHLFATPPHYIRPGLDTRETDLIGFLLSLGWHHSASFFNMTCDLKHWQDPGEGKIYPIDSAGYQVRRAEPRDRQGLAEFIQQHWTSGWRDAAALAFDHHPVSLFIAKKDRLIVGFAAYEVDQCLGTFGPTGVAEAHRGHSLGQRLLHACLHDLKKRDLNEAIIGWIGPVGFYHKACDATLGPAYWLLTKRLGD